MTRKIILNFKKSLLGRYTKDLFQLMPKKVAISVVFNGVDKLNPRNKFILLVPLLQLVGLNVGQGSIRTDCSFVSTFSLLLDYN